ncbi:9280_t:CDS:2, partial [Cetraspora pellucida]
KEGATAPMFGSVGLTFFELVAGSTSSTGDLQPFVQPLWHQVPFQVMSSGPVSFEGQWNSSGFQNEINPNVSD